MRRNICFALVAFSIMLALLCMPARPALAQEDIPATWYFAEGTTREGFHEYISLQNPEAHTATVTITYMTNEGPLGPYVHDIPPVSRGTVYVNGYLDPGLDVSVRVESDSGLVAERPMYFDYKSKWEGGHVVEGVTAASTTWYFAEGSTGPGFEEWLCIQNPQQVDLPVTVTYYMQNVVKQETYAVPAQHRHTLDINYEVARLWPQAPYQDVSIKVEAAQGIIAERPMYFAYRGDWEGGHAVVGETEPGKEWFLAEGFCDWSFETWICILNPNLEPADVAINYRSVDGAALAPQLVGVPGYSRFTIYANEVVGRGEFSFHVTSDQPIVVERPMYFTYMYAWEGGHDNMAMDRAAGEWYLAEGSTRQGIETYLCILNPLDVDQEVYITYMMEESRNEVVDFIIPARSRYTRSVNADVGPGHDVSFRIKAQKGASFAEKGGIVVERPMYFLYGGEIPGGHVASGFPLD
ncbi:MAG: hypothetical protein AB1384_03345 [Actinomycetota bacterium]